MRALTEVVSPPTTIQFEPARGCNLACTHCAVPALQPRAGVDRYSLMSEVTMRNIGAALAYACAHHGWNPRLELASGGEPTLHPELEQLVRALRAAMPKASIMLTTNGGGLLARSGARVEALFAAGLNTLALDDYEGIPIVAKLLPNIKRPILPYPTDLKNNPHQRFYGQRVVLIKDLKAATKGTHASLNNHAAIGGLPVIDAPGAAPLCVKPFREVQVHYDGVVGACCHNFSRELDVASITADPTSLAAAWTSALLRAIRRKVYARTRDFRPCYGCDYQGNRVGLLPDQNGKSAMLPPTAEDEALIRAALRLPPAQALARVPHLAALVAGAPLQPVRKRRVIAIRSDTA